MTTVRTRRVPAGSPAKVRVYDDALRRQEGSFDDESGNEMEDSRGPLEDSGFTRSDDSDEEEEEDAVVEDMRNLERSFAGFNARFRLINRIGEGINMLIDRAVTYSPVHRDVLNRLQSAGPPIRRVSK